MHIHLNEDKRVNTVTSYDVNRIVIAAESYSSSILASKDTVDLWPAVSVEAFASLSFCKPIIEHAPSLLIIGEGQVRNYVSDATFKHIINANIPYELMTFSSAIKTYNSAVLEGRNVLGAFIFSAL